MNESDVGLNVIPMPKLYSMACLHPTIPHSRPPSRKRVTEKRKQNDRARIHGIKCIKCIKQRSIHGFVASSAYSNAMLVHRYNCVDGT
jgi:hypothetical protein